MKKILIVNSSEETMRLFERWLERKSYDVKFTTNLDNVVSIIKEFKPQLIIVDIDQKEIIPAVKKHDSSLLLLLMTGFIHHEVYSALPVDDIIEKPFSLELLEKKVGQLMTAVVEPSSKH